MSTSDRTAPDDVRGEPSRVLVLVLGDLGRSPRILYHALALANNGVLVDLVGYRETSIGSAAEDHAQLRVHSLVSAKVFDRVPRLLYLPVALLRFVVQATHLLGLLLFRVDRPDALLVQSPPSLPTLPVAWCAARLRGARFVIDWHNFGDSVLALRLGNRHPVVRGVRLLEIAFGRLADDHFCVSRAMRDELATERRIDGARVLYDEPHSRFAPLAPEDRLAARAKLFDSLELPTPFRSDPALVVCPSSFTLDEDHALLLDAAKILDAAPPGVLPPIVILATGRGPGLDAFLREAEALQLERVHVQPAWLPAAEYPACLAAADLGVCLHRSTSGVDLPMKLADMRGAGLPACALDYGPCLREKLDPGGTGVLFRDAQDLAEQLTSLLAGFPPPGGRLAELAMNVAANRGPDWPTAWQRVAAPVLLER